MPWSRVAACALLVLVAATGARGAKEYFPEGVSVRKCPPPRPPFTPASPVAEHRPPPPPRGVRETRAGRRVFRVTGGRDRAYQPRWTAAARPT